MISSWRCHFLCVHRRCIPRLPRAVPAIVDSLVRPEPGLKRFVGIGAFKKQFASKVSVVEPSGLMKRRPSRMTYASQTNLPGGKLRPEAIWLAYLWT